ncbi:unnamed protein product [Peronospora effusa]|uniref:RRM domain-containing protein n=1 Tax=Peronospora effusa TaxID=542832 RepID=A0A3M6VEJ6_9STRA|nr:hypothetical protein DD238_005350 [Peronospora effusa]CAI5705129.1 unnamed protein product [Peronospora effusa]
MELPLDQNDLVMSEFRAWDAYNKLDTQASGSAFETALKRQNKLFAPLMKKLRGFEARISAISGMENVAALEEHWQQYLNFVKHRVVPLMASGTTDLEKGRQIVTCLYERAVSTLCLSPTLWKSYLEYVEVDQMNADKSEKVEWKKLVVAQRAVRNVPFDSFAWTELLVEMERKEDKPAEKISQFVRTNLLTRSSSPMDQFHLLSVLIAWCDSIRRHASTSIEGESLEDTVQQVESLVGGVFSECEQFMSKAFPDFLEGKLRLVEYRAKCYWALMPSAESSTRASAIALKVSKLNELWKKTLDTPLGNQAATWIAYFKSIRRMNVYSIDIIRTMVFDKAVQRVTDVPTVLAESWLVFERENGDLSSYLRARQYYAKHHAVARAVPAQDATPVSSFTHDEGDKLTKRAKKRKATTGVKQSKGSQMQSPAKRAKLNAYNAGGDDASSKDVGEKKIMKKAEKKQAHETLTNEHTLFLCNVSKEASKEDIEEIFKDISSLKDVRLVLKTRGDRTISRGMAYVQFTDDTGVEIGLKKDGCLLHGHPLRVERSKPPAISASTGAGKSGQGGDGFWKTDPLTIYAGDLNRKGSKEQVSEEQLQASLQQVMQSAGKLVVVNRVCILKDRHGKLKNYGLVEVAEPSQVAFCLDNVAALKAKLGDQVTLKASRFSIAHVLEQQKKQQQQKQKPQRNSSPIFLRKQSGATSKGVHEAHGRPSTRLALVSRGSVTSLMPRALRRKVAAQEKKISRIETKADAGTVIPKSNEDFRKMLLDKSSL